ncbi:hypothetical protein Tsubulata_008897, partial [Turnera subulata]
MGAISVLFFLSIPWLTAAVVPHEWTYCKNKCGNVDIPYPFGIEPQCVMDDTFGVTCKDTTNPPRPFLNSSGMELLQVSLTSGSIRVNNPVFSSNCSNMTRAAAVTLSSTNPFVLSNTSNRFIALGCDTYANLLDMAGSVLTGCLSICGASNVSDCFGINCCQTTIPPGIRSFEANVSTIFDRNDGNRCKAAFMVEQDWFYSGTKSRDDMLRMEYVPAVLQWGTCQGRCDISKVSDFVKCSYGGYCWQQLSPSHHCICTGCNPQ